MKLDPCAPGHGLGWACRCLVAAVSLNDERAGGESVMNPDCNVSHSLGALAVELKLDTPGCLWQLVEQCLSRLAAAPVDAGGHPMTVRHKTATVEDVLTKSVGDKSLLFLVEKDSAATAINIRRTKLSSRLKQK